MGGEDGKGNMENKNEEEDHKSNTGSSAYDKLIVDNEAKEKRKLLKNIVTLFEEIDKNNSNPSSPTNPTNKLNIEEHKEEEKEGQEQEQQQKQQQEKVDEEEGKDKEKNKRNHVVTNPSSGMSSSIRATTTV